QPRPDGSADAVSRALAAGPGPPLVVPTPDTGFRPGDPGRFAAAFARPQAAGAVALGPAPPPGPPRARLRGHRGGGVAVVAAGAATRAGPAGRAAVRQCLS